MEREPTEAYVYQPHQPPRNKNLDMTNAAIYEVGGPGSEPFHGLKLTKVRAEALVELINKAKP